MSGHPNKKKIAEMSHGGPFIVEINGDNDVSHKNKGVVV
jgi:hypothetical protein